MDEIFKKLYMLIYDAQNEKCHAGKEFERDNYKWCLGAKIAYKICGEAEKDMGTCSFVSDLEKEKMFVYGIEVEVDFRNSERIELWERVGSIDEC